MLVLSLGCPLSYDNGDDNGVDLMLMPGGGFVFTIYCLTQILVVSDKRILSLISIAYLNKSTLDNSPPPNYDKESKDECHHVNNNPRYKWYVKPAAFQVIAPTRSNYGRKINVKNGNKLTILIFLPAIIELVQELLISNMHNKLEEDTCENVEVIAPTRSNY